MRVRSIGAVLLLVLAGCASGEVATTTTAPLSQTTVAEPTTTMVATTEPPTTTTAAPDAAPPELAGRWGTVLDTGDPALDRVFLTFTGTDYAVSRGPASHGGVISVEGDRITFSEVFQCEGDGIYQWSVAGDTLTFTALAEDPCSFREDTLDGVTYNRQNQ